MLSSKRKLQEKPRTKTPLVVTHIFTLLFVTSLSAQSLWSGHEQRKFIGVELVKPHLRNLETTFTTSVLFLSGGLFVSPAIKLVGEVPFVHYAASGETREAGSAESGNVIGNLYLGVEIGRRPSVFYVELGFRLPLSTDRDEFFDLSRASEVGRVADPDRFEAFELYDVSWKLRLHHLGKLASNLFLHLSGGHSGGFALPRDDFINTPGLFQTFDYSVQLHYALQSLNLNAALKGRHLMDGRTFHLSPFKNQAPDRSIRHFDLSASVQLAGLQPGAYLIVPIDDFLRDNASLAVGLNMVVPIF